MPRFVLVSTTTAKQGDARRIARSLVERRLAACVQVLGPIRSTYRWQGRIETATDLVAGGWSCIQTSVLAADRATVVVPGGGPRGDFRAAREP